MYTGSHFQKNETLKKRIAFFDFDGTITTKDTLLEFIKYSKGSFLFYFGFLLNSPWLLAYKLKIISNHRAKEKILGFFFRNCPLSDFQQQCDEFATQVIPGLVRPKALREISLLQELGISLVVVSASPENWIRGWTDLKRIQLIATRLEINDGRLTKKIFGRNCNGEEKLRRIQEEYSLSDYQEIYAYGDSSGDKAMLQAAKISFYKPFL
jgi:HAD superfamily hydrolase (TIGR01490 family)